MSKKGFGGARRRRSFRRAAASLLIFAAAFSAARALEEDKSGPGLRGILAKETPDNLNSEAFSALGGNWDKWAKGTADLVNKLYADEKSTVADQRELLKTLRRKVGTIDKALADSRYASLFDQLTSLRGALVRRVDLAQAILDTFALKPEDVKAAKVKSAKAGVRKALNDLEADLKTVPNGEAWLPYVKAADIRREIADGKKADAIAATEKRLAGRDSLKDAKQRAFLARPAFGKLAASIADLRKAEGTDVKPADPKPLREKLAELVGAIEGYELDAGSSDAKKVREALDAVEGLAIDNGDLLSAAVRSHYLNYNLQLVASETGLTKIMSDNSTTSGPVVDFVMGANVSGQQTTNTTVTVDLKPNDSAAAIDLVLNGVTSSNTAGVTDQATIYTQGNHSFGAVKPVYFDGNKITTGEARMLYVNPSNTTVGADTSMSGVPLFGGIARGIAMREANRRRPQSEAIAVQRVESRVLPEFQQKTEEAFGDLNKRYQNDLKKRLEQAGVDPAHTRVRSTESHLRLSDQIVKPGELAGDVPNLQGETGHDLTVHLHASLLNNAVSRMKFAGQTMTDDQVRQEMERYLSLLAGKPVKLEAKKKADEDKTSMLVFDQVDPIRFSIENGQLSILIRAGFKQEGKEEVPTQLITVPLTVKVVGDKLRIERGTVKVAPVAAAPDRAKQIVRAGVMRKKIENSIPTADRERTFKVERPDKPTVTLTIAEVRAQNGWLTIWAD